MILVRRGKGYQPLRPVGPESFGVDGVSNPVGRDFTDRFWAATGVPSAAGRDGVAGLNDLHLGLDALP